MDVLSSRVIVRARDRERSQAFYRDVLGLAVYREFGDPAAPGLVFFLGSSLLEVSGSGAGASTDTALWLQVRDIRAEHDRLVGLDVSIVREPRTEPWGLVEMWLADPDGLPIVLVEIPVDHPLRRDQRGL
ncbi:VOC family protein [uncultured Jatrophihabitans sp.]|uniref:VOC family protein n=1 Tax=uncultured Jatrophihabitans sp. TaxID=1610747 RepID=UPI0035CA42F2